MPIKHRGHRHDTVAEVRACEFGPKKAEVDPEIAALTMSEVVELVVERPLPDGDYTVEWGEGHRTLRLAHQASDDTFMPGRQLISYLAGSDNERSYKSFGHLGEDGTLRIWRRFRGNTELAAITQALIDASDDERDEMHSGRCGRCGRKLTVPASKSMGLGPRCAEMVGV